MNIIYPETLLLSFPKILNSYYIIIGNVLNLIEESTNIILNLAEHNGFSKLSIQKFNYNFEYKNALFSMKEQHLFFKKKILYIFITKKISTKETQNCLSQIEKNLTSNILVIIYIKKLNIYELNIIKEKYSKSDSTIIICEFFHKNLSTWMTSKLRNLKVKITQDAQQLLINYYQENVIHLNNLLNIMPLIWPKTLITITLISYLIEYLTIFTPIQWINALLTNDIKLSTEILNQFEKRKLNPVILIRYLQHDLITMLLIKRENFKNCYVILNTKQIKPNRHHLLINFARQKNYAIIYKSIKLLTSIEVQIKKNNIQLIWLRFQTLSSILCS